MKMRATNVGQLSPPPAPSRATTRSSTTIEVAPGGGLADAAGDFAVNKELGVKLLAAEGIASQSFQHRVVDGTAYVVGEAKS